MKIKSKAYHAQNNCHKHLSFNIEKHILSYCYCHITKLTVWKLRIRKKEYIISYEETLNPYECHTASDGWGTVQLTWIREKRIRKRNVRITYKWTILTLLDTIGIQLNKEKKNTKVETYVPPKAAPVIVQKCPLLPAM